MNEKSPPIKIAIVGYGWWGKTLTTLLDQNPLFEIQAIIDNNTIANTEAKAAGFSTHIDLDFALKDPQIHAVFLCTPHSEHAYQLLACAFANKHTFCEKPLCPTPLEALKAVKLFEQKNLILGVGHDRRFSAPILQLINSIKAGEIGKILQVDGVFSHNKFLKLPSNHWRLSTTECPVGPLSSGGLHLIDLAISILGPVKSVWAKLGSATSLLPNGDALSIMLNFYGGQNAVLSNMLVSQFDGRFTVYGTKGWIEIREKTHKENLGDWVVTKKIEGSEYSEEVVKSASGIELNLEAFGKAILEKSEYPINYSEVLHGIATYEAINDSIKTGTVNSVLRIS